MPEKLARSVVVTPCCRHHSLTERPLLRHSWICAAHSCSSARCFNSALVILTSHNTTVAKPFATFRYYCLMCVYARLGLTVTAHPFCPTIFKLNNIFYHGQSRIIQIKYGHMQCAVSAGSAQPIGYLRPARTVHNNFQFNETKRQCRYISYIEVYMQRTNFLHSAERLFLSVFSSYICSAISDMNS